MSLLLTDRSARTRTPGAPPSPRNKLLRALRLLGSLYTYVGFVRCGSPLPCLTLPYCRTAVLPYYLATALLLYATTRPWDGRVPRALAPLVMPLARRLCTQATLRSARSVQPRIDLPAHQGTRLHLV